MVGCVGVLKRSEERAQLRWLLLDKKYRGRGIGRGLAEKGIEYSKELGVKVVYLSTIKGLEATRLYESLGFKVVSEREADLYGDIRIEQMYELSL